MRLIKLESPMSNMYGASYVALAMVKTINVEQSGGTWKIWVDIGTGTDRFLWFTSTKRESEVLSEIEEKLDIYRKGGQNE